MKIAIFLILSFIYISFLNRNKTEEKEQVTDLKINENGAIGKLISVTPNKSPRKVRL